MCSHLSLCSGCSFGQEQGTAVVRRGCVKPGHSSLSPTWLWPWDIRAGSMGRNTGQSRQHQAHHCASATVLPPMGRAEVPQVSHQHIGLPALVTAMQDCCGRASAARREGSLRLSPGNPLPLQLMCLVSPSGHPCHRCPVLHVSGCSAGQDDGRRQNPHCGAHHQPYSRPAGPS